MRRPLPLRGITLIDVLVGTAIVLIMFLGIAGALRASLQLTSAAKSRAAATAVANAQIESVRGMEYANIGTVGGIPDGVIPQVATTTVNGLPYVVRTFVQYVDDPSDGVGLDDENGIPTDYKRVRVAVSYVAGGRDKEVTLTTTRSPRGIETTENGGTLVVRVVDANGIAVPSAQVRIQNTGTLPTIDLTTFTGSSGVVSLPGAPAASGYRVTVSKVGYNGAQTYDQDVNNVSPNPGHLTVALAATTQGTFAIDALASASFRTFLPVRDESFIDSFTGLLSIASSTAVTTDAGALVLSDDGAGGYLLWGRAEAVSVSPSQLSSWGSLDGTLTTPPGTSALIRVYGVSGSSRTLIPDAVLPGNALGFSSFPVSLANLSTSTYPELSLDAEFVSSGGATPQLHDWTLSYTNGPFPFGPVTISIVGAKSIGTDGSGLPIPKSSWSQATDGSGVLDLVNLEWDSYALAITGNAMAEVCAPDPVALAPAAAETIRITLASTTANSLRAVVRDAGNALIDGATLSLTRSGFSASRLSSCGQGYFGGLGSFTDYELTVSKTGYTTEVVSGIDPSGGAVVTVSLE